MPKGKATASPRTWREYESQVFEQFRAKYPEHDLSYDQRLVGRYCRVPRQIDILVKANIVDSELIGVFDCKHFNNRVNVRVIDSMVGFLDDIGAQFGGVISASGFSEAAINRARAASIELKVIPFESPETLIDQFIPSFDFSDPRNSMYIPLLF